MSGYYIRQEPYIDEYGIYVPDREYVPEGTASTFHCVITKEMFIEAYNMWIKDTIVEAGRSHSETQKHQFARPKVDLDVDDCYD